MTAIMIPEKNRSQLFQLALVNAFLLGSSRTDIQSLDCNRISPGCEIAYYDHQNNYHEEQYYLIIIASSF